MLKRNMYETMNSINIPRFFGSLKPSAKEQIATFLIPRKFAPNETIFRQEETGDCLYFIQNGKIKICDIAPDGSEIVFGFLGDGDLLGEMAVIDGGLRSTTAIAVEETDALMMERQQFLQFLQSFPEAGLGIIDLLCRRLRYTDRQLTEVTSLDVSARLARKLIEISPCVYSQEELSLIVGASRVMVNRVLHSFEKRGLITISRKKILITNSKELRSLAKYK
jgi:CRP/FNR family transcriptional regulator, cyclic AMP receptor protein